MYLEQDQLSIIIVLGYLCIFARAQNEKQYITMAERGGDDIMELILNLDRSNKTTDEDGTFEKGGC